MLASKDLVPIGLKFKVGIKSGQSPVQQFSKLYVVSGSINRNVRAEMLNYGKVLNYDLAVILNACDTTRMIDYDTVFYIDEMPTNNMPAGNCYVAELLPERNGQIIVGLKRKEGLGYPRIYYAIGDTIYEYQMNFDSDKLIGYVPKNALLPFNESSKVWIKARPINVSQTANLVKLKGTMNVGLAAWYSNFKQLTFEAVDGKA